MADPTTDRSPDLDQEILIWAKLQVPKDLELDTEWAGLFQPLIRASGHEGSGWARLQSPDMILLDGRVPWIRENSQPHLPLSSIRRILRVRE